MRQGNEEIDCLSTEEQSTTQSGGTVCCHVHENVSGFCVVILGCHSKRSQKVAVWDNDLKDRQTGEGVTCWW